MMTRIISAIAAAAVSALLITSCQKNVFSIPTGEEIIFSVGNGSVETKASYSGGTNAAGTIERIDWQTGDLIRIYCGQVSEPEEKYADYVVSEVIGSDGARSRARIGHTSLGQLGLRWGTGSHTFYSVYPSPGAGGIATGINGASVTANLPGTQAFAGSITETSGNFVVSPDLKNMLMTAKASWTEANIPEGDEVFLSFTPLTTAVKFTIKNNSGSPLELTGVQLISGNGKTSAPVINGEFSVNLDETGISSGTTVKPFESEGNGFAITYSQDYPKCTTSTPTSTDISKRTLSIAVGTDSAPLKLAVGKTLSFTFFLNPCHNFDDLTFKFIKKGGAWMSTRLGYTDGSGIFFPRHKKTTVEGILVPGGAQWSVKYDPTVKQWDNGENEDLELSSSTPSAGFFGEELSSYSSNGF